MKTRISALIHTELYDNFLEYAPAYHKSKILESLLIKYLEDGICNIPKLQRGKVYACSFTIESSVWDSFRDMVIKGKRNEILEALLKQFMESRQIET